MQGHLFTPSTFHRRHRCIIIELSQVTNTIMRVVFVSGAATAASTPTFRDPWRGTFLNYKLFIHELLLRNKQSSALKARNLQTYSWPDAPHFNKQNKQTKKREVQIRTPFYSNGLNVQWAREVEWQGVPVPLLAAHLQLVPPCQTHNKIAQPEFRHLMPSLLIQSWSLFLCFSVFFFLTNR